MTEIFDDPAAFADEALDGFVAANRQYVARVDGGVVRSTETAPGQVAVVIGGGPATIRPSQGWSAPGWRRAAPAGTCSPLPPPGRYTASPKQRRPTAGFSSATETTPGTCSTSAGTGQAERRGDRDADLAGDRRHRQRPAGGDRKRRGIAGDLTVFKVAGAAAEAGRDLDEVERLAIQANHRTRSLGVAFAGCTLPGAGKPLFTVPEGMMSSAWASTASRASRNTPADGRRTGHAPGRRPAQGHARRPGAPGGGPPQRPRTP